MANFDEEKSETNAKELLHRLNVWITAALGERDQRIAWTREYWDSKPHCMLNDKLESIEIEKHYAQFILETVDLRGQREIIIDALTRIEMAKPSAIFVKSVQPIE